MPANINDYFTKASSGTRPSSTTLTAIKSIGAASISCGALTGWATDTAVHFIIYTTDSNGNKTAGSQTDWKGIVSGSTITGLELQAGTDTSYAVGSIVEAGPTAAWADDMVTGALVGHEQTGLHKAFTETSIVPTAAIQNSAVTTAKVANSNITAEKLATSAITLGHSAIATSFTTSSTAAVQVTGLTVTVTIPAGGRNVKITAFAPDISANTITTSRLEIWDGTVGTGTKLTHHAASVANAGYFIALNAVAVVTPSAGSKTYNVGLSQTGTASQTLAAGITTPAFILVEAI